MVEAVDRDHVSAIEHPEGLEPEVRRQLPGHGLEPLWSVGSQSGVLPVSRHPVTVDRRGVPVTEKLGTGGEDDLLAAHGHLPGTASR